MQLNMRRTVIPLKLVTDLLSKAETFAPTPGALAYAKKLLANIQKNSDNKLDPVSFSIAMYHALHGLNRKHEAEAKNFFPVLMRKLAATGEPATTFVSEMKKFTDQFFGTIKPMR